MTLNYPSREEVEKYAHKFIQISKGKPIPSVVDQCLNSGFNWETAIEKAKLYAKTEEPERSHLALDLVANS